MPEISNHHFRMFSDYIQEGIEELYSEKFRKLEKLKLDDILYRKNLYLFKSKYLKSPEDLINSIIEAFISSSEETTFGNFLEKLAIYVSQTLENGKKSTATGIDLEIDRSGIRYLIDIKSGPNWGNSSQITKMLENFRKANKTIRTSGSGIRAEFINGCCYGVDDNPDKGEYLKLCGQRFWEFITGDAEFYLKIIEPMGLNAKERSEKFLKLFDEKLIQFSQVFYSNYVKANKIDWEKLIKTNSGIKKNRN